MKRFITIIGIMAVCLIMCSYAKFSNTDEAKPIENHSCYYSKKDTQCAAITKRGTRCKRKAEKNSRYCWQHK